MANNTLYKAQLLNTQNGNLETKNGQTLKLKSTVATTGQLK